MRGRLWPKPGPRVRFRRGSLGILCTLACATALADHGGPPTDYGEYDHDRARHALARGEVRPLAEILTMVMAHTPGEVIEVEFEPWGRRGERRWAYEFEIIAPDGRLQEVYVDAASGEILGTEYEDDD